MNMMNARHTISIHNNVYSRLVKKGKFGESFTELISRLLDFVEQQEKTTGNVGRR